MFNADIQQCLTDWLGVEYRIEAHKKGANSAGYLIHRQQQCYFLKCYPQHSSSVLRMQREIDFIEYCTAMNYHHLAQVHHYSMEHYCVLFNFIPSSSNSHILSEIALSESALAKLAEDEDNQTVSQQALFVEQAFTFIKAINPHSNSSVLRSSLAHASDAAFKLADFSTLVERRFEQLQQTAVSPVFASQVSALIKRLAHYYQKRMGGSVSCVELTPYVIASPSDFGLHNALKHLSDKHFYFIDFEYAGQDSLWKLFADFFAQPQFPIHIKYITQLTQFLSVDEIKQQADSLCIAFQLTLIKWCLLMLQTGLRQYNNHSDADKITEQSMQAFKAHLQQVEHYFEGVEGKVALMKTQLAAICHE